VAATGMQGALIFLILIAPGGYLGSICMHLANKWQVVIACIAASGVQTLPTLAAITQQSCHPVEKNKDAS